MSLYVKSLTYTKNSYSTIPAMWYNSLSSLIVTLSLSILLVRGDHCVWDCTCTSKVQSNTNQSNASHVHNISISYLSIGDRSDKHGSTNDLDTYSDLEKMTGSSVNVLRSNIWSRWEFKCYFIIRKLKIMMYWILIKDDPLLFCKCLIRILSFSISNLTRRLFL